MYIKDNDGGFVHEYGTNPHDSLMISDDGKCLYYYNLQCGEGSRFGTYSFLTENKLLVIDDPEAYLMGAEYADINCSSFVSHVIDKLRRSGWTVIEPIIDEQTERECEE